MLRTICLKKNTVEFARLPYISMKFSLRLHNVNYQKPGIFLDNGWQILGAAPSINPSLAGPQSTSWAGQGIQGPP
jgi:hypothetical protein